MSSETDRGGSASVSERSARDEAFTLAAYRDALDELSPCRHDPGSLLAHLGDVDRQAAHAVSDTRLTLAGRLIAAAQMSERVQLPEREVHALVRAWLSSSEAERDDAAPARAPRVTPEEERVDGFTQSLLESQREGRFSRAAWGIAGTLLRHLIRPAIDVSRALCLRDALEPLARAALELVEEPPQNSSGDTTQAVLTASALRVRGAADVLHDDTSGQPERKRAWLDIAAGAAGGHARWSGAASRSISDGLARATERLGASLVPEQPERFAREAALEQAIQAAFDAAVTALGMAVYPADPIFVHGKRDVLESLLEAASSGLIGAWVTDRTRG